MPLAITDGLYVEAMWAMGFFLFVLLMVQSRCRCDFARACSALEYIYLPVYVLAIMADWLQGPYVYALYIALGVGRTDINVLFVMGFGTSMVLGPFIGQLADQFGRKNMILFMYCGAYALACVTKHFDLYWMLAIGRFLGGAATSVLFSCFESWLVAEHHRRMLDPQVLNQVLARQYFLNGLAGCSMGILAQYAVDSIPLRQATGSWADFAHGHLFFFGEALPFDMSASCLLLAAVLICFTWSENIWFGNRPPAGGGGGEEGGEAQWRIGEALKLLASDKLLLTIMVVAAATESAMYAFVIEWTPALTTDTYTPPHGMVFSCFMIAYMSGSTIFGLFSPCVGDGVSGAARLLIGFSFLSFCALFVTWLLFHTGANAHDEGVFAIFLLLTTFELGLGGYMAAIATLKASYVPDDLRATVYNIFRVPLNLIVVVINVISLSSEFTFLACVCLMSIALLGSFLILAQHNARERLAASKDPKGGAEPVEPGFWGLFSAPKVSISTQTQSSPAGAQALV